MRVGRDQHGEDCRGVAAAMEVLQIEGIVPGLVVGPAVVPALAALELEGEDGGSDHEHGIDAAAESRNIELEVQVPIQAGQRSSQDLDLLSPCGQLRPFDGDVTVAGQLAKD